MKKWGWEPEDFYHKNKRGIEVDDSIRFEYKGPFEPKEVDGSGEKTK
jgi:hypothetical protein